MALLKCKTKSPVLRYYNLFCLLFSISSTFSSPSLKIQGCLKGITVDHTANHFTIKSSTETSSNSEVDCLIQPFNASNAFLSFDLVEDTEQPITNSSVQTQQIHVSVTDELGQLLMRRDIKKIKTQRDVYKLHVCPSFIFSKDSLFHVHIQGNIRFRIVGQLDERLISADEPVEVNITPENEFDMRSFILPEEIVQKNVFDVTVRSETETECVLVVSRNCLEVQQNKLVHYNIDSAVTLTFQNFGRVTLSKGSKPNISQGHWFVGIFPPKSSETKNITVSASAGSNYSFIAVLYMILVSLTMAVVIAVFSHFFLNRSNTNINCTSCVHGSTANAQNTHIVNEIYSDTPFPIIDLIEDVNIKPSKCPLLNKWFKVIVRRWFGKGEKTFSYTTGIVCITLLIGTIQFLIANWNDMVDSGNRDICYYNEACYHPLVQADIPFNLIISNLPYIINGFILALSMSVREATIVKDDSTPCESVVDQDLSIAYALAWALVFEGLFSGFYHLCPSRLTFQFDSAFMFVMSGLIIVALFNEHLRKCRCEHPLGHPHPSSLKPIKAPKYFLFFVCPIFVLNYIGSLQNTKGLSIAGDVIFYSLLVIWLCGMYFWVGYRLEIFSFRGVSCSALFACKICMMYFLLPAGIVTMGIISYKDWSSFFLFTSIIASGLSVLGSIIADIFKGYTKYHDRVGRGQLAYLSKRMTNIAVVLRVFFVLALTACWCVAIYYFQFLPVTNKILKPSESRNLNQPCLVWHFFDAHDLWHFWSSFGLLMGVYLLLYYA